MNGSLSGTTLLVHRACRSQLTHARGVLFCEVCGRAVAPDETMEVDNSPSPFSG